MPLLSHSPLPSHICWLSADFSGPQEVSIQDSAYVLAFHSLAVKSLKGGAGPKHPDSVGRYVGSFNGSRLKRQTSLTSMLYSPDTWPHLAAREARKCSLAASSGRGGNGFGGQ